MGFWIWDLGFETTKRHVPQKPLAPAGRRGVSRGAKLTLPIFVSCDVVFRARRMVAALQISEFPAMATPAAVGVAVVE